MAPRLGWIGLGNMGRGMSTNIVHKANLEYPLVLYNRTKKRTEDFSATLPQGKSVVASAIEEVVEKSDIIFSCVGDDKAITDTIATAVKAGVKGKLFVDCSTVHPDTTNQLAKILEAEGAGFVAMPVFGAPAMADSGQLVCVLAGPAKDTDRVKPYTTGVIGRAVIDYSGQAQGQATLLKVIGNTFILSVVETLSQGHVLAEKSGLGVENLQQFIRAMFPGPYVPYSERMSNGDYFTRTEPLWAVDLAKKDATHALELANATGARLRFVEIALEHLHVLKAHKGEKGDIAGIYGAVRQESGMKFENQ